MRQFKILSYLSLRHSLFYISPGENVTITNTFFLQTTRGTGADVIIIDEAAHIDHKLFFKTIIPILSMKNTSLLCLSSPEGDSNYYSALMNLKREDNPKESFFNVIECFRICKNCMKLERVKAIQCTHVKNNAHWLSARKIKELKQLYKASPEDAIREFGGIVVSDYLPALRKEDIEKTFAAPTETTISSPTYIFTCCDPTGAGPSQLSIASGYYNNQGDVVVSGIFLSLYTGCTCLFVSAPPPGVQRQTNT
jgi:hypothetical protein